MATLNSMSQHTWPCPLNCTAFTLEQDRDIPLPLKPKRKRSKTCLENLSIALPTSSHFTRAQVNPMTAWEGAGPESRSVLQALLHLIPHLSEDLKVNNKQNHPFPIKSLSNTKMHLDSQGSCSFNFHLIYEKRLFLPINKKQS